ncbi:MAG TPA: hypothetical protein EYM30_04765 [Verrucomicrobia bacterium]|nr:hypothetical protein [Verrucomicrobiota bacterium]
MKHLTVNTILAAALGLCTIPSHATAQQAPKVQKTEKGLAYKRGGRIDFEVPNSHNGGERLEDVLKTLAGHFRSKTVNFIFSSKGIAGVRVPAMQLKNVIPQDIMHFIVAAAKPPIKMKAIGQVPDSRFPESEPAGYYIELDLEKVQTHPTDGPPVTRVYSMMPVSHFKFNVIYRAISQSLEIDGTDHNKVIVHEHVETKVIIVRSSERVQTLIINLMEALSKSDFRRF